ncbi:hypothetical protein BU15DRAFT_88999 [Melanogaster broomeanus]|nr:hypothetical protein BU15DRAFT_88999 [Melanogaster broomeanus]
MCTAFGGVQRHQKKRRPGCERWFKSKAGRTRHHHSTHPDPPPAVHHDHRTLVPDPPLPCTRTHTPPANEAELQNFSPPPHSPAPNRSLSPEGRAEFHGNYHPKLDGHPCNELREFLPPGMPPPPYTERPFGDWAPYRNRIEFELAEFLFKRNQMSAKHIDTLLDLWAATLLEHGKQPPFANHRDLYNVIDSTPLGSVPWKSFTISYTEGDEQQWQDFMSGSWAWSQADEIARDPDTHGATFVPNCPGLRQNDGLCWNRAHRDAVSVTAFLAIPKTTKEHRFIYGLGPYIADYEEQVLLSCIVHGWCPKYMFVTTVMTWTADSLCRCREHTETLLEQATLQELWSEYGIVCRSLMIFHVPNIHELLSPDILHQLIKGAFKDHLVDWVEHYLRHANHILDDIDRRRFPQGRGFKQWTGDDSKALIEGLQYLWMSIKAFRAFLDFCYMVHRDVITELTLGVVPTFSLPRQHSMAKHVKAVKEPWRRSSRFNALGQMLLTNQRLDKLSAAREDFHKHAGCWTGLVSQKQVGRVVVSNFPNATIVLVSLGRVLRCNGDENENEDARDEVQPEEDIEDIEVDNGADRARNINDLAVELSIPQLPTLLHHFLFQQLYPDDERDPSQIPPNMLPHFDRRIWVFNSASSRFFAPSDLSGIKGMRREYIRACPSWRNNYPRYDCVFVNTNPELEGMAGMTIARVICFFSFKSDHTLYPCAVACGWFSPAFCANRTPDIAVIHIDAIYRAAHLIPIYGRHSVPPDIKYYHSYDTFRAFYVNKYADHHAFEIAF